MEPTRRLPFLNRDRNRQARFVAFLLFAILVTGCTSSYVGRWVFWNFSSIADHERFPAESVSSSGTAGFRFGEADGKQAFVVSIERKGRSEEVDLAELARRTHTTALLVIRRDTLLFEGYFNGYTRESINTSFSTAKSVSSLLAGIAVDRGYITDLKDPVTTYLPELALRDVRFERLTLEHLLDMRSGLRWRDHDFITGDKPRAYYHPHLRRLVLEELPFTGEPGAAWQYNSYNPILLGLVLERATGRSPAMLLEEWLWRPLDMEFNASWSVDGTREPMVKMESGINARAIDFARIGRLVLNHGRWNADSIISRSWIEASTHFADECRLDEFGFPAMCYRRGWWLPELEADIGAIIAATGHLGQYVYIFPDLEVVIVRFGRKTGGVSWPTIFRQVARQIVEPMIHRPLSACGDANRVSRLCPGSPFAG
jgi:CubicO group peptidase (beta-lactamase class C family)